MAEPGPFLSAAAPSTTGLRVFNNTNSLSDRTGN